MRVVGVLAMFLVSVSFSASFAADRLRIAYSSISAAYTGIWVAQDAGFFAKEGLDSQVIFIGSATQLAQVLVAGDVDIASLGGGPVMAASLSGADLKVIGNNVNKLIFSLHARPEIKSIEELRGKRIAVSRFGSSSDVAARHALRKHNLDPLKDITLMQLGTMSNMFGALKSGAVEASMVSPPTQFLSEKMGFKEILSVTDMDLAYPNPAMAVSGDLIRRRPDIIDRFMRAYVRAIHRARIDRDSTIKTLAKYTTVTDSALLARSYDFYMTKVLERAPYINMQGMQNALDDVARTVPAAKNAKPEQFVDLRFLDRMEKSGLLKELYK
ncbi:MAG TPA: ABC transporter substrate-binding protein [Candidatus Binatia bacterium]|nr:ABC transporter substrate-binding protein [Candidatus Binatia bacterium]